MDVSSNRKSANVKFLEEQDLIIYTKRKEDASRRNPPKLKGKHFANLEYLADGELVYLTGDGSKPFPSPFYARIADDSYFEQCFHPLEKLGEGSFGSVVMAVERSDMKIYAVKVSKEPFKSDKDRASKINEVIHHQTLSGHPNIVALHLAWEEDRYLYLQMELCQNCLVMYTPLPEEKCWEVLGDIASALAHVHSLDYAHLDVKSENIQLGYDGRYKLGDFGLVHKFGVVSEEGPQEGDAKYLAPEMLSMHKPITKKADVYSLGISVLELAGNLILPSNGPVWQALRENTFPYAETEHLSDELFVLLTKMMSHEAYQRPSAIEILEMPSIKAVLTKERLPTAMPTVDEDLARQVLTRRSASARADGASSSGRQSLPNCSGRQSLSSSSGRPSLEGNENLVTSTPFQNGHNGPNCLLTVNNLRHASSLSPTRFDQQGNAQNASSTNAHVFPTPSYTNSGASGTSAASGTSGASAVSGTASGASAADSFEGFLSPASPQIRASLAHLSIPGSVMETLESHVGLAAPSFLGFGLSPMRLSNQLKEQVKDSKRRRLMTPRNLSSTFDEECDC